MYSICGGTPGGRGGGGAGTGPESGREEQGEGEAQGASAAVQEGWCYEWATGGPRGYQAGEA